MSNHLRPAFAAFAVVGAGLMIYRRPEMANYVLLAGLASLACGYIIAWFVDEWRSR